MGGFSFLASLLLSMLVVHSYLYHEVKSDNDQLINKNRETLEIIIGGGGVSTSAPAPSPENEDYPPLPCAPPPPPPPPCPPPLSPPLPPFKSPLPQLRSPPPPSPKPSPSLPPSTPKPPPQPPGGFVSPQIGAAFYAFKKFRRSVDLVNGDPKGFVKSWQGKDVCNYKGVLCDYLPFSKNKAVAGVDINGAGITGPRGSQLPLRGFLDRLNDIVFLHANSNNLTGSVPDTSKFQYFYELDLSNNKLSGEFPREVLRAKNLTFLDLRFNDFTGPVPPELFNLDVDVLFINNNRFTQQIPYNLGSSRAHYFTFANNEFTGPIPSSIGQASKTLYEILLLGNKLSGCLPYEIGRLNEATVFDASCNLLAGPIPHSFGCLAMMRNLSLANNQLYGPVPELVCKLSNVAQFSLGSNYFTEVGPECQKLVNKGILDVSKNCILDQPNQKSKAECANFFSMPRKCPNERLMTFIPCKKYLGSNEMKSANPVPSAPLSYGALTPHRH